MYITRPAVAFCAQFRTGFIGVFVFMCCAVIVAPLHAGGVKLRYRVVAETGMHAPETAPGVVFGALTTPLNHNMLIPVIDEAGRVSFMAMLDGPGIDVSNFQGMWAEQGGALRLVARGGQSAPGTEPGTNFRGVPSLELPGAPEFGAGQAVFGAELVGSGLDVTNDQGLWAGAPGNIQLVARENDPVPGLPGLTFGIPFGTINEAGHVYVGNHLRGPGVDGSNRSALHTDRSGSLALFLRQGDPAPFTPAGTVISGNPTPLRYVAFNDNSQFALSVRLDGPSVDTHTNEALYVERGGALQLVLRESDPAPGVGAGVTFGGNSIDLGIQFLSFNNNGRLAFNLKLGGAVSTTSAMFSDRSGTLQPVAVSGDPLPGTSFDYGVLTSPLLNDNDKIAFGASYPDDDTDPFTPPPFAVLSDVGGTILPVVEPGDATVEGEIIDTVSLRGFNAAGQMLLAITTDATNFRSGIWLRDVGGALHRIAAIGDAFDVHGDGSDNRNVLRVVPGGMNEAGQVSVRLDFTDNSSVHFVAQLASVGDFDGDGDVDLGDFAQFSLCFGGANVPPAAACPPGVDADFDDDGDVDLSDFSEFSLNFTGPL